VGAVTPGRGLPDRQAHFHQDGVRPVREHRRHQVLGALAAVRVPDHQDEGTVRGDREDLVGRSRLGVRLSRSRLSGRAPTRAGSPGRPRCPGRAPTAGGDSRRRPGLAEPGGMSPSSRGARSVVPGWPGRRSPGAGGRRPVVNSVSHAACSALRASVEHVLQLSVGGIDSSGEVGSLHKGLRHRGNDLVRGVSGSPVLRVKR